MKIQGQIEPIISNNVDEVGDSVVEFSMSYFRRSGRKNSRLSIQLAADNVQGMYAETKNVSETGMFVNTTNMSSPSNVAVGDTVSLNIYSAEQFLESAAVEVVRVTEDGFGCAFV